MKPETETPWPRTPGDSIVTVEGHSISIESNGKKVTTERPDLTREELLYIALGGTLEQYKAESEIRKREQRQAELRSQIVPGKRFKADSKMLELYPLMPVWEIVRELSCSTNVCGQVINNDRKTKWWCSPVGWSGQYETICCWEHIEEGFFQDEKDLPCPLYDKITT